MVLITSRFCGLDLHPSRPRCRPDNHRPPAYPLPCRLRAVASLHQCALVQAGFAATVQWPLYGTGCFTPVSCNTLQAAAFPGGTFSVLQVLFENLPVALAAVDCDGTEESITECQSNDSLIGMCTNITSSTVLACANSADGELSACTRA